MEEAKAAKKVGIIGIICNFILLILKFVIGIISKSQGLLADAVNSFSDVFSSLVTYIGGIISSKPRDEDHEFGHGKAEFVASFLIGIFMTIASIIMLYNALMSIINKETFEISIYTILIPIITIVIKLMMYIYCNKKGKEYNSLLISVNAKDHRNDLIISTGVLVGMLFGYYGYYFVDGIVGMLISLFIIITGIRITYEAYDVLIDKCIDIDLYNEIKEDLEKIDGVRHIDNILSKPTGSHHILIVKISVDPEMTVRESHKIAGKIRYEFNKRREIYDTIVHINPDGDL